MKGNHMATLFPSILIFLMFFASIAYFMVKDYRRGTYWLAGAILNISVTW